MNSENYRYSPPHRIEINQPTYLILLSVFEERKRLRLDFKGFNEKMGEMIDRLAELGVDVSPGVRQPPKPQKPQYMSQQYWEMCEWFRENKVHFAVRHHKPSSADVSLMTGSLIRQSKRGVGRIMKRTVGTVPRYAQERYVLYIATDANLIHYKMRF